MSAVKDLIRVARLKVEWIRNAGWIRVFSGRKWGLIDLPRWWPRWKRRAWEAARWLWCDSSCRRCAAEWTRSEPASWGQPCDLAATWQRGRDRSGRPRVAPSGNPPSPKTPANHIILISTTLVLLIYHSQVSTPVHRYNGGVTIKNRVEVKYLIDGRFVIEENSSSLDMIALGGHMQWCQTVLGFGGERRSTFQQQVDDGFVAGSRRTMQRG